MAENKLGPLAAGALVLPFDKDQFSEFVCGVLGKPQTIQATVSGNAHRRRTRGTRVEGAWPTLAG